MANKQGAARKFVNLTAFMLRMLPGYRWKLSTTLLLGCGEIVILILLPLLGARIINSLVAQNWEEFRGTIVLLVLLTLAQTILGFTHRYVLMRTDERVGNNLRQGIVDRVLGKHLQFFEEHWVGDIVSRIVNDSSLLKNFLTGILLQTIGDTLSLLVVTVILLKMHPVLALLTIAAAPITIIYGRSAQRRLESLSLRVRENVAAVTGHLQSWLSHPFALKALALENVAAQCFGRKNDKLTASSIEAGVFGGLIGVINVTVLSIPSILIFGYGGYITLNGDLSIGALFAFITFSSYFNGPIQRLIGIFLVTLPTLYPIQQRIEEFIATDEFDEPETEALSQRITRILVQEVHFGFVGTRPFELLIPSFIARQGEVVGLVGPNGSGKSTLLRLLAGIYQPNEGRITLEAADGRSYSAMEARKSVAVLPQEPALFDGTLLENVTVFDAVPDEKRLSHIERELDLSGWLASLPSGWKTEVNAGIATTFSGGQMQKIGLGRVLYRDLPIVLLDEPANGLDESTRETVARILSSLKADHIVILISHSNETIHLCDRLYRMEPVGAKGYQCSEEISPDKLAIRAKQQSYDHEVYVS